MTYTHSLHLHCTVDCFSSSTRELQFLADQERISPAAIKKTTLDKVLQQPGVTVSGVANGNGRSGLSLFNTRNPVIKKKNWVHRKAGTHKHITVSKCAAEWTCIFNCWVKKRKETVSRLIWNQIQITSPNYLFILEWNAHVYSGSVIHTCTTFCCDTALLSTHTQIQIHWRTKVHLQSVSVWALRCLELLNSNDPLSHHGILVDAC